MIQSLAWGYIAYNGLVAICFAYDKWRAKRGSSRIPEKTLLILAAFFGAAGALISMHAARHKTHKPKFRFGVPILLCVQLGVAAACLVSRV